MDDGSGLALLGLAAFATAALTAVAGLGGGIVLLAAMLLFLDPLVAIPLHGVIQLVSNGSRTLLQWRHVRRDLVLVYALPLLPTAWLGLRASSALDANLLTALIGAFVLVATWAPRWLLLGARPERLPARPRFAVMGALVGLLSTSAGATGPLQGPFFQGLGLGRIGIVGTFAACQMLAHLAKIAVFGFAGFGFAAHLSTLLVGAAGVTAGTWAGTQLLERVSEGAFQKLHRGVISVMALELLIVDGSRWLAGFGG